MEWMRVVLVEMVIRLTSVAASSLVFGVVIVYDLCQGVWPRSSHVYVLWWFICRLIEVDIYILIGIVQVPWWHCLFGVADS